MAVTSELNYEVVPGWGVPPPRFSYREVCGVVADSHDRVYVLTRDASLVLIYERDGAFVGSWGEGLFAGRPHGITIGPDDSVYCVDDGNHVVHKFTPAGAHVMTLGTPGIAAQTGYVVSKGVASITHSGPPFNRPTSIAVAPNGELYVADGYGNARVHRFSPDGQLLQSWGEPGTGPGQFHIVRGIFVTADDLVLVADRENDRIQIFDLHGKHLRQWTHVQRPTDVFVDREGRVYVSELPWYPGECSFTNGPIKEKLPARVSVLDLDGRVVASIGGPEGAAPGSFWAPHSLCVDSRGDLYVGEVTYSFAAMGKAGLVPPGCHNLQKFARL